jgi:hypothetical protein
MNSNFNPEEILEDIKALKNKLVRHQLYGVAVHLRDAEKVFEDDLQRKYTDDVLFQIRNAQLQDKIDRLSQKKDNNE